MKGVAVCVGLSLAVQGVRDGSQVLAVLLSEEEAEAARRQEQQKMAEESLMKTRQAAEILATRELCSWKFVGKEVLCYFVCVMDTRLCIFVFYFNLFI